MARGAKRATRWFNVISNRTVLASAAGGSVASITLLTEAELEAFQGRAVIERVVGDIRLSRVGTTGLVLMSLIAAPRQVLFTAGDLTAANAPENLESPTVMWTKMWSDMDLSFNDQSIAVDVRTRRKMGQDMELNLWFSNLTLSAAADNVSFAAWLRVLVRLP